MKDNSKLMALYADTSKRHASLVMNEIETLINGNEYRRSRDLQLLIPVWDWEHKEPTENNTDTEVGLTVHVITRLRSTLDEEHIKWETGYGKFSIEKRLRLLAAINAERRTLEVQLHIKPTTQLLEEMPAMFQVPPLRSAKTPAQPVLSEARN